MPYALATQFANFWSLRDEPRVRSRQCDAKVIGDPIKQSSKLTGEPIKSTVKPTLRITLAAGIRA